MSSIIEVSFLVLDDHFPAICVISVSFKALSNNHLRIMITKSLCIYYSLVVDHQKFNDFSLLIFVFTNTFNVFIKFAFATTTMVVYTILNVH